MFILITANVPNFCDSPYVTSVLYADDTTGFIVADSLEESQGALKEYTKKLSEYSSATGLCLNETKTSHLCLCSGSTSGAIDFLGVRLDPKLNFRAHNERILADIKARIGSIRRLKAYIPQGKLLWQVAQALVVGRLLCAAWVTRPIDSLANQQEYISQNATSTQK